MQNRKLRLMGKLLLDNKIYFLAALLCTVMTVIIEFITPIVLADCGLDETGRQRAEFLTQNNNCVTVLLPSQLEDYIT